MANEMNPDEEPKKAIYTYEAPWNHIKAMNWSVRKDKKWRLGIGSFWGFPGIMSILQLDVKTGYMKADPKLCFHQPYPATKMMFIPDKECQKPDLLATTAEHLRIWQVRDYNDRVDMKSLLNSNKESRTTGIKALTSFDWNEYDPKRIGTCCNDRTCTIWDIVRESVDAQMIAHDDIVHDISWGSVTDFATASADGSVRIFDVRHKERSLILYENYQPGPGLLRLGWNKQNYMYMATIIQGSPKVIVLDIRRPGMPVIELNRRSARRANAIAWAPHSSYHIGSVGDDTMALIWDVLRYMQTELVDVDGGLVPHLQYSAGVAIEELQWSSAEPNWLAMAYTNKLQILASPPENKLNHSRV